MLQLGESENRILEELRNAGERGLSNKDLLKMPGMFPSNLSKFLKRLQDPSQPLIVRDVNTRNYRILEGGKEVLDRKGEMMIISRTKRSLSRELEPSNEVIAPRIVPIGATVYLGPEIEELIAETANEIMTYTEGPIGKDQAREAILSEIVAPVAAHVDNLFAQRFFGLAHDWRIYRIQQMQPAERREYLLKRHSMLLPADRRSKAGREQMERTWREIDFDYMRQRLPEGGPRPLTLDTLLDFEAAVLVSVSREKMKKNATAIRYRLALHLLAHAIPYMSEMLGARLRPGDLTAMTEAGIITAEEFGQVRNAKGDKKKVKVLEELYRKYYRLAWGKDLEKPYVSRILARG